jgi:polysaccharide export outer membrane protein
MKIRQGLILALLAALLAGCQTVEYPPTSERITPSTPVRLSPGDVIKVTFSDSSDLNQTQKIKIDGKVNLPLIGEVKAAGKTLIGFQRQIADRYSSQLEDEEILVTLEVNGASVIVSGFVGRPGKLTFDRPTTVFQAIMEAGGATAYGNLNKVRLIRTVDGKQYVGLLNMKPALKGRVTEGTYIKDGDVIYVPQRLF